MGDLAKKDDNVHPSIMAVDAIDGDIYNIWLDKDNHAIRVNQYVWDEDLLQWIKATASAAGGESTDNYKDSRVEYVDGYPIFLGYHASMNADTANTQWLVVKIDYTSGQITQAREQANISWDNRANGWS